MQPLDLDPIWTEIKFSRFPRPNTRNRAVQKRFRRALRRAAKKAWYREQARYEKVTR